MSTIEQAREKIPAPDKLYDTCVTLAVLEFLAGGEYPQFRTAINPDGSRWFMYDDGGGNSVTVLFSNAGVVIKGFDHESCMSPYGTDDGKIWPGLFNGFPAAFLPHLKEAALFGEGGLERFPAKLDDGAEVPVASVTFCAWWDGAAKTWAHGKIPFPKFGRLESDGASFLIGSLETDSYYDYDWGEAMIARVEAHEELTGDALKDLDEQPDPKKLAAFLAAVGYAQPCPYKF